MYRIVILSDLHFGGSHFFRQGGRDPHSASLAEALLQSIDPGFLAGGIDCLVLPGDFFSTETDADLGLAREEIRACVTALRPAHVVTVPGNHDLTWDTRFSDDRQYYYKRLASDLEDVGLIAVSDGEPRVTVIEKGELKPIAILLLDSCVLEGQEMRGLGRIGDPQLALIAERLEQAGVSSSTHRLIAVLHHHLLPVLAAPLPSDHDPREGPFPRISLTVDAVELMRRLVVHGFSLAIHGHQHHRAVLEFANQTWRERPGRIHVIASGSCGARSVRRQFFAIELDDEEARVMSYAQHADYGPLFERDPDFDDVITVAFD